MCAILCVHTIYNNTYYIHTIRLERSLDLCAAAAPKIDTLCRMPPRVSTSLDYRTDTEQPHALH